MIYNQMCINAYIINTIKDDLKLSDRIYECSCGNVMDRDLNAALNLKQLPKAIGEVTPMDTSSYTVDEVGIYKYSLLSI